MKKRVTGIGGLFFKAKDPAAMRGWYERHLGIPNMSKYGGVFEWRKEESPEETGYTVWNAFPEDTAYLKPSQKPFMFNFRVENLEALLEILEKEGVEIVGEMETFDYGKFAWIMDPEGNKIELWEPDDEVFRKVTDL
jgi:predicted enzyme related to lactoylglutathione lyase